jgi:hypothetical protein
VTAAFVRDSFLGEQPSALFPMELGDVLVPDMQREMPQMLSCQEIGQRFPEGRRANRAMRRGIQLHIFRHRMDSLDLCLVFRRGYGFREA